MLEKFAEELQQLRLEKDIPLEQVAKVTRIDKRFLEAIEDGDFAFQPELYIKAFIKDYVKALNGDPDLFIKKYEAAKQGRVYEEVKPEPPKKKSLSFVREKETPAKEKNFEEKDDLESIKTENEKVEKAAEQKEEIKKELDTQQEVKSQQYIQEPIAKTYSSKPSFNAITDYSSVGEYKSSTIDKQWIVIGGLAIFFILVVIVYFLFFSGSSSKIVTETPYTETQEENSNRFAEPIKDSLKNETPTVSGDSLLLTIIAVEKTWIQVQCDSAKYKEFNLKPEDTIYIKAKNGFSVFTGKAKTMKVLLNNAPLEINADKNSAKIKINRNGVEKIITKPGTKSDGDQNSKGN